MCLQKRQEFLWKRELSVMGFLPGNVTTDRFHLGLADCEGALSVLPMKTTELGETLTNPARRVCLDRPQNIGDCLVLLQANPEMDLVGDPIGDQTKATLAANRTTQVFPQAGPQLSLKPGFPALGGKPKVIEKAGIGMGQEAPRMWVSVTPAGFGAVVAIVPQGCAAAPQRLRMTLG